MTMNYESSTSVESKLQPGVTFVIAKMSFGRRMELMQRIREVALRFEFLNSGDAPKEKLEAALLSAEMDRVYLTWGLRQLTGLEVDGVAATPEALAAAGPENLLQEAVAAIKAECGLSETERKN
jgi:hypothetical protein